VFTDSDPPPVPGRSPSASACEPHREWIEQAVRHGRDAMAIWQDLVDDWEFTHSYQSVRRFVVKLRGEPTPEAHPAIQTAPGEEGQVDYGDGPMVRHPESGKYRRTRLFVFTLGCSRKSVRFLTFRSSSKIWAELHERAFRRLGGAPRVTVPEYVPRNIFEILFPTRLCDRGTPCAGRDRRSSRSGEHNVRATRAS
jgi:transposase